MSDAFIQDLQAVNQTKLSELFKDMADNTTANEEKYRIKVELIKFLKKTVVKKGYNTFLEKKKSGAW